MSNACLIFLTSHVITTIDVSIKMHRMHVILCPTFKVYVGEYPQNFQSFPTCHIFPATIISVHIHAYTVDMFLKSHANVH